MKNIPTLLFALIFFTSFQIFAQDKPAALIKGEAASVCENLVKVEALFLNPLGISYEKKLGKHFSLYSLVGLLSTYGGGMVAEQNYGARPYYVFTPHITVQQRYYHNLSKRAATDKNTSYNSANYVGLGTRFYHEGIFISNAENYPKGSAIFDLMLSYGLQRSFFKKLNWDMAIQPGIEFYDGQAEFFLGLNLQLGFVVFSN